MLNLDFATSTVLQCILGALIAVYLVITGYVKLYHEFMSYQPVFHTYDLHRWVMGDHVIDPLPPKKNKFYDPVRVTVRILGGMVDEDEIRSAVPVEDFSALIRDHYMNHTTSAYGVDSAHLLSFLTGNKHQALVSWYREDADGPIVGTMTTRPVFATIRGTRHVIVYTDHLCIHADYRRRNIAAKLIQTTVYVKRHEIPHFQIAMFKREGARMVGVVPVLVYMSRMFRNRMRSADTESMPGRERLYRIDVAKAKGGGGHDTANRRAFHDMMDFVAAQRSRFDMFVIPYVDNLWAQIVGGVLIPFVVYDEAVIPPVVVAAYIYKNSAVTHMVDGEKVACVELIASVAKSRGTNHRIYFTHTLAALSPDFGCIVMEEVSDTNGLVGFARSISELTELYAQSSEYIMFNYAAHPVSPDKALLIGI